MAAEITGITKTPLSGNKTDSSKATSNNTIDRNNQGSERVENTHNTRAAAPVDKVTLTQQAEKLRMIEKAINDQTDLDNERVENLKLEIDAGRYDINAQRVAEKLIEFEILFVT
ncbi:MAG: flagellar biosynthesis anti-sigma factor FlgM [Gammaproteobacteria bacterium]|nr:flagellar biosynthesis anti-sigma factor FlgM [Gammaproteobacteria bacterium]